MHRRRFNGADALVRMLQLNGVKYIFGLATNAVLKARMKALADELGARRDRSGARVSAISRACSP